MSIVQVRCDRATLPSDLKTGRSTVIEINQKKPNLNLRVDIINISHKLLSSLDPIARDLLDIASYVYHVDQSVSRGTEKDVFDEAWSREFFFVVPVRKPKIWNNPDVTKQLQEFLNFLTEDQFHFSFEQRDAQPEQLIFSEIRDSLPFHPKADCVSLFSGGMDSLTGAIELVLSGRKPILASHQPRQVLTSMQRHLAGELRKRNLGWEYPHLGITINRKGDPAIETSQRSRSFLFLAFGVLIAHELNIKEIFVCENGITTFNLPRLGQTIGTQASRTTHPFSLSLFKTLASSLFKDNFEITNPFLWMTRAEVMRNLKTHSFSEMLPLTTSCNHSRRPKIYPHCGVCSQCVDRRFAHINNDLENLDGELTGFERDIFADSLGEGVERFQPVSAVQFALEIRQLDIDRFCERFPQIYDAVEVLPGDPDEILQNIFDLHQRYAAEVVSAMQQKESENWERKVNNEIPQDSLLMLFSKPSSSLLDSSQNLRAEELDIALNKCLPSENTSYENVIEAILTFLFCENLPENLALRKPISQNNSDQGYKRRDLVFENRTSAGYWMEVRQNYNADGIIVDAKNYNDMIDGTVVEDFAGKYLSNIGLSRFGILIARKVPSETRRPIGSTERVPSAIETQKKLWERDPHKLVVLIDDDDLHKMLRMKVNGENPSDLIRDRVFMLKQRIG